MNFVKSFDFFGVPARQVPCSTGRGAPTTATEGAVGCLYMDTDTGNMYKCTAAAGGAYTWIEAGNGSEQNSNDGFSPIATVTQTSEGADISITDKNGTTTATVNHGQDGYTPQKGKDYHDGEPGKDGVSPVVAVSKSGKVTTISITDKNGTKTATINDGADGYTPVKGKDYFDGDPGAPGTSVTVTKVTESTADGGSNVVQFSDGKTLTVRNGVKGNKGDTPVKGVDYFTDTDKAEMVNSVLAALPTWTGGSY